MNYTHFAHGNSSSLVHTEEEEEVVCNNILINIT